eukprot:CAMPEP_0184299880 /NCGR_PEP_ID=MMETSP1049-20130417/10410_1 /TAXON_ID=77928 /ORGANISM="Proteomonas sulcata, Strain CCMP704" /LENGTH=234 /DNA_ID=CAMNT_0026610443 /DNA_START=48 /DNA_END=749 /DNA_ORIENTATION=+
MPKQDFGKIYYNQTPAQYISVLTPLDYGHYHDRLNVMIHDEMLALNDQVVSVELGSSYGNTTISYRCGYDWEKTSEFWLDDSKPVEDKRPIKVIGVDISAEALQFGKDRGIFQEIVVHDFKDPFGEKIDFTNSNMMISIMTTYYIPTERWLEACYKFLADRSQPKLLVYNMLMAFDKRNWSPEVLFAGVPGWRSSTSFDKHRNFSETEKETRKGCNEAWTLTYFVHFDALGDAA